MSRRKILYLDVPFENESGGDKNRSRFLFQTLREKFDVDLVLLGREGASQRPAWTNFKPLAMFAPQPAPWPRPSAAPAFLATDHAVFEKILREDNFDAVICRFTAGWELLRQVETISPKTAVIVDEDMLSSRLVALSWAANPSFKRRWFLFEKWKLQCFEKRLFRDPWQFLFTNSTELAEVRDRVAPQPAAGEFVLVPNTMPRIAQITDAKRQPAILFFGSMDSAANTDGFAFLVDEVLPLLDAELKSRGVEIHVVGKNPPAHFRERLARSGGDCVKIIGGVDSIERAIAESLFVLLPLRIASGTRTRILEAAAQKRAVVTTPIGAEGLDVAETTLIGKNAAELAAHTKHLLSNPTEADALGAKLGECCVSLYAPDKVAADFVNSVEKLIVRKQGGTR
jgi:glycosyltransferase involved in cell wall biosynthesis